MHSVADLIKVVVIVNKILSAVDKGGKTGVYDSAVGANLQAAIVSIDNNDFPELINKLSDIGSAYCCCCSTGIPFTSEQIIKIISILETIINDLKSIFKKQAAEKNIDFTINQINLFFLTL